MEQQETTASSVPSVRRSPGTTSVTPLLQAREVRRTAEEILGRVPSESIPPLALMAAEVFPALRQSLAGFSPRVTLARTGELALGFSNGRRHAVLTADPDGELTILLTDRASEDEPEASVVGHDALSIHERIKDFLGS